MQNRIKNDYALIDYTLEDCPLVKRGSKEKLQQEMEELIKANPMYPDRYDVLPYEVYELAWGFRFGE